MLDPRKMVNYNVLFTALSLLLYPRHIALIATLVHLLRAILLVVPPLRSITATVTALNKLARLLFLSATLVLATHSGIRILRFLLIWIAGTIDVVVPRYISHWIWIVESTEWGFVIFRWVTVFIIQWRKLGDCRLPADLRERIRPISLKMILSRFKRLGRLSGLMVLTL